MPRFSANLSFLFGEFPMLERFEAAAACGFSAVEYMWPYEYELSALKERLRRFSLEQVLFNLPAGNFAGGVDRGIAADPARVAEFRAGVAEAKKIAPELGVRRTNCLAGKRRPDVSDAEQRATLIANLRHAAAELGEVGVTVVVEPLNRLETPDFFVGTTAEAASIIADAGAPNLGIQYDCYHAQRVEGNIIDTFRKNVALIKHVQIADPPSRNEPGSGELAYDRILRAFDEAGYDGWIGLEYKPSRATAETFDWIERYGFTRSPAVKAPKVKAPA